MKSKFEEELKNAKDNISHEINWKFLSKFFDSSALEDSGPGSQDSSAIHAHNDEHQSHFRKLRYDGKYNNFVFGVKFDVIPSVFRTSQKLRRGLSLLENEYIDNDKQSNMRNNTFDAEE